MIIIFYRPVEFEFNDCIEAPMELLEDEFWDEFTDFTEADDWHF